jgi:hypothetical protein
MGGERIKSRGTTQRQQSRNVSTSLDMTNYS